MGHTNLNLFLLALLAVAKTSLAGWKATDVIGVVRCSRLLTGSGERCRSSCPFAPMERSDAESYRLTIPVEELNPSAHVTQEKYELTQPQCTAHHPTDGSYYPQSSGRPSSV